MNTRPFDATPETFEHPHMNYDAAMRRELGIPPFGAIEEVAETMFDQFAWKVAAAASIFAGALCMG